jgi:adenylate cyclase
VAEGDGEGQTTGAQSATPDVFISYASANSAVAEAACEAIEQAGMTCWIAPRDVTPGASYAGQIIHAIDAAKAVVLILSQHAASSPHVLREVERAASKRHPIISLRIDQAPLPADFEYFLNTSHWLDASAGDTVRAMSKLVSAVQIAIQAPEVTPGSTPTAPTAAPSRYAPPTNRTAIVVACVVGLAIAGFAADRLWLSSRRAVSTPAPTVPVSAPAAPTIPEKSVAVLPFVDMSEKKDQEYFSDGMSEELIDMLTKIPDLRVPARTSSFYFKGKQATIAEIAKALGVAHVLEGSVRKSGKTLRVTAQLIRVDNGYHMWSQTYDRTLVDVFKTQDEIARAVVQALKVSLLNGAQVLTTATPNPEAYSLYLQARSFKQQGTSLGYQKCIDYLRRAVTLDPTFSPAWAALATAYMDQQGFFQDRPYQEYRAAAFKAAETAKKLDPDSSEAHLAMADLFYYLDWDWDAAGRELMLVLAGDPNNANALRTAARLANTRGDYREGQGFAERAISIDPVNFRSYGSLAAAYYGRGDLQQAESALRKAIELNPNGAIVHYWLVGVLLAQGKSAEAFTTIQNEPDPKFRDEGLALIVDTDEHRGKADRALAEVEMRDASSGAFQIANAYAMRHDLDKTFAWLDRAFRQHDGRLLGVRYILPPDVRTDRRFKDLLRKMNLPVRDDVAD